MSAPLIDLETGSLYMGASGRKGPYRASAAGPGFPLLCFLAIPAQAPESLKKHTASIPCAFRAGAFFAHKKGKVALNIYRDERPEF
jgi:hypothetical protein